MIRSHSNPLISLLMIILSEERDALKTRAKEMANATLFMFEEEKHIYQCLKEDLSSMKSLEGWL